MRKRKTTNGHGWLLALECLEKRQLLTAVTLSSRYEAHPTGVMAYAHVEDVSDHVLDIEITAGASESVLIKLTDGISVTSLTAYGSDGEVLSNWEVLDSPWQALNPGTGWISGTASPHEGTHRIHVEFSRDQGVYFNESVYVEALFGVKPIELDPDDIPERVELEFESTSPDEESFLGWIPQLELVPTVRPVSGPWAISYSNSADKAIWPNSVDPATDVLQLPSPTITDDSFDFYSGVWISYESATGRLVVRSSEHSPITAFEMTNEEGLFTGPTPASHGDNPFNVYKPNKLFSLNMPPHGRSFFDFGNVLPPGMTRDEMTSKFRIDGAHQGGGGLSTIVFSVDGDIPFEQAIQKVKRVLPWEAVSSYADTSIKLYGHNSQELHVDYHWDASLRGVNGAEMIPRASIRYRDVGSSFWQTLFDLEPCKDECHATGIVSGYDGMFELRVENSSFGAPLTISSLELNSAFVRQPIRFPLDVAEDELVTIMAGYDSNGFTIRDSAERIVASEVSSVRLGGTEEGTSRYYVDLLPTSPLIAMKLLRQPWTQKVVQPSAYATANRFFLNLSGEIDQRSCSFSNVTWDGPELISSELFHWNASFEFMGPTEQRLYTLKVPANACRLTSGDWVAGGDYIIDYLPPKVASIPMENATVPMGTHSAVIYFDEPIYANSYVAQPASIRDKATNHIVESGQWASSYVPEALRIKLPLLPPGEYELVIGALDVSDMNSNQVTMDGLTFSFRVAEEAGDAEQMAFDVDRNQVIDPRDFGFFLADLWDTPEPSMDLNGDGEVSEEDADEWIERTGIFPVGDVSMDGVFDEIDLEWLSYMALDSPATWRTGDFDGDGFYTTADMTLAMQGGLQEDDEA